MGGPGSGGFKSTPGDVETHKEWDIIDDGNDGLDGTGTVSCSLQASQLGLRDSRGSRKYDASIAQGKWPSIPLASERISWAVRATSTRWRSRGLKQP